jgi:hypothetical protein
VSAQLEMLKQLNLQIRLDLEQAEAKIPALNEQIDQLSRTGLLDGEAVLGDVIFTRAYYEQPEREGGLVMQAAVLVPGGFGVVEWDSDDYLTVSESYGPSFAQARTRFRGFGDLEPALRARLLSQVESILNRLLGKAFPVLPNPPTPATGWE